MHRFDKLIVSCELRRIIVLPFLCSALDLDLTSARNACTLDLVNPRFVKVY